MTSLFLWTGGTVARLVQGLLILLAGGVALALGHELWVGTWKTALDWGTGAVILIGPVSAAAAALVYSTMSRRHWDLFVAGMRRGWAAWLGPLTGVWLVGLAAMLTCTVVALGLASALGAHATPPMLWAVPLVSITLAAQVGLGAVVGVSLPAAVSVPVAAVLTFLLEALSVSGPIPGIFRTGGVTGDLAGETYNFEVLMLDAAVCALLAAGFGLALAFHVFPVRRSRTLAAVAGTLLLAALPWWVLESGDDYRYAYEANPRLVCTGSAPEVCLSRDTVRPLEAVSRELHRQAAPLLELGVELPDRFVQVLPTGGDEDDGYLSFVDAWSSADTADPQLVSRALATPRACAEYSSYSIPEHALEGRSLLADWIATQSDVPRFGGWTTPEQRRWLDLPVDQQAAWVTSTYDALRECRLRDVRLPF